MHGEAGDFLPLASREDAGLAFLHLEALGFEDFGDAFEQVVHQFLAGTGNRDVICVAGVSAAVVTCKLLQFAVEPHADQIRQGRRRWRTLWQGAVARAEFSQDPRGGFRQPDGFQ